MRRMTLCTAIGALMCTAVICACGTAPARTAAAGDASRGASTAVPGSGAALPAPLVAAGPHTAAMPSAGQSGGTHGAHATASPSATATHPATGMTGGGAGRLPARRAVTHDVHAPAVHHVRAAGHVEPGTVLRLQRRVEHLELPRLADPLCLLLRQLVRRRDHEQQRGRRGRQDLPELPQGLQQPPPGHLPAVGDQHVRRHSPEFGHLRERLRHLAQQRRGELQDRGHGLDGQPRAVPRRNGCKARPRSTGAGTAHGGARAAAASTSRSSPTRTSCPGP